MTKKERLQVLELFHIQKPNLIGYSDEQKSLIYHGFDLALNKAYTLAIKHNLLPKEE